MERRWWNPSQPQTLQIAVALLYMHAVLGVLFGAAFTPLGLVYTAAVAGAGYGIANEKRWGYGLGITVSVLALLPFAYLALTDGILELLGIGVLLGLVFPVARLALLLHAESRNYQRVWFK